MIWPARGIRPRVGASPTTLLFAVGLRIETPVSLPRPICANTAASAAPVPPLEPPGVRSRLYGLLVRPSTVLWSPSFGTPNQSLMLTLASTIAPASRSRLTTVASWIGCEFFIGKKPAVVGRSAVSNRSLSTTGTPCSGLRGPVSRRSASSARAVSSAAGFSVMTELMRGPCLSYASILAR